MKEFLGQYAKVIITALCVVSVVGFLLSTGASSFRAKMPEAQSQYEKEDSIDKVEDISKRQPPKITTNTVKLEANQTYNFKSPRFVSVENEDGTMDHVTLTVVSVKQPNGDYMEHPEEDFTAVKGLYVVTYKAVEIYQTAERTSIKAVTYLAD